MKKIYVSSLCFFAICFVSFSNQLNAQTMTGTVLVQPCTNNGQIGVTVTGLTPPISYTYNNWTANNITIVHTAVTTVTDIVGGLLAYQDAGWNNNNVWQINASDGTNSAWTTLILTPPFFDSITVTNPLCPASIGTLAAINFTGGTAPFNVVWTNTTTALNYSTNPAIAPVGIYSVMITDGAGCKVISVPTPSGSPIGISPIPSFNFNITGTQANCTNGTASVGVISGGTAPFTYLWNNSATTPILSGLIQGFYNCTVTDAIGCQQTSGYYVSQAVTINYNSSVTNATCLQNNGSVLSFVTGGAFPYSYAWSNSATSQNLTAVAGGTSYIVQITDANGCTGIGYVSVGVTTPISVTYTASPSSCTTPNGSATLTPTGGTGPYSVVWYTFPLTSTSTAISNFGPGTYSFKVTDANGCIQTGSAIIPPTSIITAVITNGSPVCPATTGNISVSASSTSGPLTYLWNTAATTSAITAAIGSYNCVITDAGGCQVTKYGYISQISPVSVGFSSIPSTCIYSNNGSAMASASGGTAPYTYTWSNSQTGANATALLSGQYYVSVTDANGCQNTPQNNHVFVGYNAANNSCYCAITGTVYNDINTNCIRNTGENGIPNILVHCTGYGYTFTDANGIYTFLVPTGTYTLNETVQSFYPLAACQSNTQVVSVIAASNCSMTVNFANTILPVHDLHIIHTDNGGPPIPGNIYSHGMIVQNEGTLLENTIKLGYQHDGQLSYSNCAPWTLTQQNSTTYPNWYSITSGFPVLNVGSNTASYISYNVPTNIPINTIVNFNDTTASAAPIATNWLTDYTPWNNVNYHQAVVVASYDPNYKEVSPQGLGASGGITSKDSLLTYIVHFQNTGTYFAQNIVVVDTLDTDLKITSLRPGYSDHTYTVSLSDNGVAKFTFKNINLPWKSQYGDALSSGMFVYSVKTKKNLALGTQFKNKAAIYFDYNSPIITNTTLNTLVAAGPLSIQEFKTSRMDKMLLYPNPTTGDFMLLYDSPENSSGLLNIFDISGREVSTKNINIGAGQNSFTENTGHLQNGIYLVQLKTSTETITKKLVVAK